MNLLHKLKFSILLVSVLFSNVQAENEKDGSQPWQTYLSVESANWSGVDLKKAQKRFDELGSAAFMVVENGAVVTAWGRSDATIKNLFSAQEFDEPDVWEADRKRQN